MIWMRQDRVREREREGFMVFGELWLLQSRSFGETIKVVVKLEPRSHDQTDMEVPFLVSGWRCFIARCFHYAQSR